MQSTTVRHALYDHCLRGNSYAAFGWAGMGVGGEWDAVAKSLNTTFQLVGDTKEGARCSNADVSDVIDATGALGIVESLGTENSPEVRGPLEYLL